MGVVGSEQQAPVLEEERKGKRAFLPGAQLIRQNRYAAIEFLSPKVTTMYYYSQERARGQGLLSF